MSIEDVSNDDLIAEVNRRLDAGMFSPYTVMTHHQKDWMYRYGFIRSAIWVVGLELGNDASALWYLGTLVDMIENAPPFEHELKVTGRAINTTLPGRESEV